MNLRQSAMNFSTSLRLRLIPTLQTVEDHNIWNLQLEIFWAGLWAAVSTFNGAFAVRLGATDIQIGWLSSFPALLAIIVSLPAGGLIESRPSPLQFILRLLIVHRFYFLLAALIPWIVPRPYQGLVLVMALIVMTIPAHIFNVGFTGMLADFVPEQKRSAVFTNRNILYGIALSVSTFLAGQWLSRMVFPLNYQILYLVGLLGGLLSYRYLLRLRLPEGAKPVPKEAVARTGEGLSARLAGFRRVLAENSEFIRINVNTLLYSLGAWVVAPLYVLFYVRELGASDAWLGTYNTAAYIASIVGWVFWRRIVVRWGESRTLKLTVYLMAVLPIMAGLSANLTVALLGVMLQNFVAPGVSLSHINTLLKVVPAGRRSTYMGIYTALMNAGAFVCPLIGIALSRQFGLAPTLIGVGLFWVLGSSAFTWLPVRVPDTIAMAVAHR